MKLLIVDDSKAIRIENQRALERVGYQVICADDGESALRILRAQSVDLILLDLLLPKMSGLDVLKRVKRNPATANIPVVILSSLSGKNRDKLIAAGAEEYLEKNTLMPHPGENLLPKVLEGLIYRIGLRHHSSWANAPGQH